MRVGEYIRTRDGEIYKITKFDGFNIGIDYDLYSYGYDDYKEQYYFLTDSFEYGEVDKHYIIKSSPNIIDLIKVGDYVNGHKVRAVYLEGTTHYIKLEPRDEKGTRTYNEDIKSIVTKELFKAMEYEVK